MTASMMTISGYLPMVVGIVLLIASILDFAYYRLPNKLFVVIFYLFPLYIVLTLNFFLVSNYLIFLATMIVGFGLFAFSILGGGDAKLLAAVSLWMGIDHIVPFMVWMLILGTIIALLYLTCSRPIGLVTAKIREGIQKQVLLKKGIQYLVPDIDSIEGEVAVLQQARMIPYGIAIAGSGLFILLKRMV